MSYTGYVDPHTSDFIYSALALAKRLGRDVLYPEDLVDNRYVLDEEGYRLAFEVLAGEGVTVSPEPPEPPSMCTLNVYRKDLVTTVEIHRDSMCRGVGSNLQEALHDLCRNIEGEHLPKAREAHSAFDRLFRVAQLEDALRAIAEEVPDGP